MRIFAALGGFDHGLYVEKWAPFVKFNEDILFSFEYAFIIDSMFFFILQYDTYFNLGHMIKFATYILIWDIF